VERILKLKIQSLILLILGIFFTIPGQSCINPGMLEPSIPDRRHISRQFCQICRKCPQIFRQFKHLGETVCKYGLCLDLRGPAFRGFCRGQGVTRKFIPVPLTILCLVSEFELVSRNYATRLKKLVLVHCDS